AQVYIMQHRRARWPAIFPAWGCLARRGIGEIEMSKFNFASHGRFLLLAVGRYGGIVDGRLGVQNVIEPPHGSGASLKNVRDETECDDGKDQLNHVGIKSNEFAQRDLLEDDLPASEP